MRNRTGFTLLILFTLFAAAFLPFSGSYVGAQELSLGLNGTLYQQNNHIDDGAGFESVLNFKLDKYPVVFRMGFSQIWSYAITNLLADEDLIGSRTFEPSLLLRFDVGPVLQPYIGAGIGFHSFSRKIEGFALSIVSGDTLSITVNDNLSNATSPVFILGTNLIITPRISLNFNFRYSVVKPDLDRIISYAADILPDEIFKETLELDTKFISLGVRIHILKGSRFRNSERARFNSNNSAVFPRKRY